MVIPQLVILESTSYHTIREYPGDYVFTLRGALHMVVNEEFNVAEAINFINKSWK